MQVVVEGERFSLLQASILVTLSRGPSRVSDLVSTLLKLGFRSRSSVYTALYELIDRGFVERFEEEGAIYVKLTSSGRHVAQKLPSRLGETLGPLTSLISYIVHEPREPWVSIAEELEDPESLQAYREYLLKELDRVEKKLSRWKRIRVD